MVRFVALRATKNPVLVIGDRELADQLKKALSKKHTVHYCEDRDKVDELRAKTETMLYGVVVLHKGLEA